jgi:DNA-binding beta-propeller fold protein YncE
VSQPRISVYASSADGNAVPTRVIQGSRTRQARTSHYVSIDPIRDEFAVPNPFAQAILFFRGGADGNEAPLRTLQGPKTLLNQPDNVAVDPVHGEAFVAQFTTDSILVFPNTADGDVAPIRILHGPHTKLDGPIRVEVDPENDLMAVTTRDAVVFFNRTDEGDATPKWVLSGPKTGLGFSRITRDVKLYPKGKKIIAAARIRGRLPGPPGVEPFGDGHFIGVWQYGDNGDVEPWAVLRATPYTELMGRRLAFNEKTGDLFVGGDGIVQIYNLPEIFEAE